MNNDVIITIKGMQFGGDNASDSIANQYEGRFFEREGHKYLMYQEKIDGTEADTKCLIKVAFNEVNVTKRGAVNVEMPFKVGKKQLTNYDTQFGGITLGFKTKNITCQETASSLSIDIDYKLEMNYEFVADCQINITAKNVE